MLACDYANNDDANMLMVSRFNVYHVRHYHANINQITEIYWNAYKLRTGQINIKSRDHQSY